MTGDQGTRETTWFCVTVYIVMALLIDAAYQLHISIGGTRVDHTEMVSTLFFFSIWVPLIPLIVRAAQRFPLERGRRLRSLEVHFFVALVFSFLTLFAHKLVFCPKGARYFHCVLYYRAEAWMARWFALDYFIYGAIVAGIWAVDAINATRRRQMQVSAMERDLASAELRLMNAQIRPDMLIDSFRSIASQVVSDPARAEKRITLLADYLRLNVRTVGANDLTVADDVELLRSWVAMTHESDPVEVTTDIPTSLLCTPIVTPRLPALLPSLASFKRLRVRAEERDLVIEADGSEIGRVVLEGA